MTEHSRSDEVFGKSRISSSHLESQSDTLRANLLQAAMCLAQVMSTIVIVLEHVVNVRAVTADVHVLAANSTDQAGEGPHTNAPRVTLVWWPNYLVSPLPLRLASDGPKV